MILRRLGSCQLSSPGHRGRGAGKRQVGSRGWRMDRRPYPPTYQTSPYPAPLLAWLSLGPGKRKPFLAQALDPGPHVTSHFMPVPPESRVQQVG